MYSKDAINVPIALSAFKDGDQGPSKVTKTVTEMIDWAFRTNALSIG